MNGEAVFVEVAHDLRGAIGSLRLVISSLIDEEDPAHRAVMLQLADDEALRMAAGLAALPALSLAITDATPAQPVDLRAAMAAAGAVAARYGARVELGDVPAASVAGRPGVIALALPALLLLACGIEGECEVSGEVVAGGVEVTCTGGPLWPQARHLVPHLAQAVGGASDTGAAGVRFTLSVLG